MANFDLKRYFESRGQSLTDTPEALKEAATALLNAPAGLTNNSSYRDWADTALRALNDPRGDGTWGGHSAYAWLTGAAQPSRAKRVFDTFGESYKEEQAKLQNEAANIANLSDIAKLSPTEGAKVLASVQPRLDEYAKKVQAFNKNWTDIGFTEYKPPVFQYNKDGYIEQTTEGERNRTVGRSGEPLKKQVNADGTFSIIGANSGKLYQDGFTDEASLNQRMTEMQAGFAEPLQQVGGANGADGAAGAAGANGAAGGTGTGSASADAYLDALGGSVDKQVAAAQAQGFTVTPEMRSAYLAQAKTELDPYYGEQIRMAELDMGKSLGRIVEDAHSAEKITADNYRAALTNKQESLQDRGMLYGGVRKQEEQALADTTNTTFDQIRKNFGRNLTDTSLAAEQTLGSTGAAVKGAALGQTKDIGRVIAGTPEFSFGSDTNIYKPVGDIYGDLKRDITYNENTRANNLEAQERDRFSQIA